jgi:hypothetical protein
MDASRMGILCVFGGGGVVGFSLREGSGSMADGDGVIWERRLVGMGIVGREGGAAVVELEGTGFVCNECVR